MTLQVSALSYGVLDIVSITVGVVTASVIYLVFSRGPNLDAFPTVGSDSWLDSWRAGQNFQTNGVKLIQEGYEKYKSAPFKIADRYRWFVVVGNLQHLEEIRNAPDDVLSFNEAAFETLMTKYTLGPSVYHNPYHIDVVRSHLTRNLSALYPEMRDEISVAFEEILGLRDNEWKSIPALDLTQQVVCRASNRLFVGLPLCRDSDWVDLNLHFALDVVRAKQMILRFPRFLAPLVAHFMTSVPGSTKRAMKHLGPIIEERLKCLKEYGDNWAEKPNDLITWLLNEAQGPERTVKLLAIRTLTINFSGIHTSANSFTQALLLLAENPQYIQPLREEVESVVEREGWSKASLAKMRKIDSFLKESQRMVGGGTASMPRVALKDFTFSDGTFIPKGTLIIAPSRSLHFNNEYYNNARRFDPFRFCNMHDKEGEGTKHRFISTSPEYLPFGHGKHACPGRFLAANELKSMLAHIVVSYDVKLEDGTTRPQPIQDDINISPNPLAKVMFRKRVY